jgi:hypothetical protein
MQIEGKEYLSTKEAAEIIGDRFVLITPSHRRQKIKEGKELDWIHV